jgi:hypothetical protein
MKILSVVNEASILHSEAMDLSIFAITLIHKGLRSCERKLILKGEDKMVYFSLSLKL